jgi:uncharacterized protein
MNQEKTKRARRAGGRQKHIPLRTCVSCRAKDAKREFVRIVRTPDRTVVIDPTGKQNGRGAYLCRRKSCWEKAASGTVLEQALNVEIDDETRERLRTYADHHFRDE